MYLGRQQKMKWKAHRTVVWVHFHLQESIEYSSERFVIIIQNGNDPISTVVSKIIHHFDATENGIGMMNTSNENVSNRYDSNRQRVNNGRFLSEDLSKIDNPVNSNVLSITMRSVHIITYALCMQCQQITVCNGLNETFCIRGR